MANRHHAVRGEGMSDKKPSSEHAVSPVIDALENSPGIGRFLVFGILLCLVTAIVGILGKERLGETVYIGILGFFATIGIFFLFTLVLGMVRISSRQDASELVNELLLDLDTGIVVTNKSGQVKYSNKAYASLMGFQEAADITNVEAVFSKHAEASEIMYRMANAIKSDKPHVEEVRLSGGLFSQEEGSRWFRINAREMRPTENSSNLTVWQITDVTKDRVGQEIAFQQLQDAVQYLDHAPAGFMASDDDGRLVYVNATLADWLGLDLAHFQPGELRMRDLISTDNLTLLNTISPEGNSATTKVLDLDMVKSDNEMLPVRLFYKTVITADGAPGNIRTLVLNRSTEAGDADAIRDAEIRFSRFFNSTPVAIAGINADGEIIRTNVPFEKMFSSVVAKNGSAKGLKYLDMVAKEDGVGLQKSFEDALASKGDIKPVDLSLNGDDNRYIRFFVSHVADATGSENIDTKDEERVIIYGMEITEQRALESNFAKGQKMQAVGQLAGGIAHDFNNVLTAIIGFSDLLLNNHKPSDPSFQDIMNIKQNANRAASLVRQLLAFSRRQTLRPQVLHLSDVLFDLRMLLDRLLGEKVKLNITHGRDLWPIKADISQLEQVIVNLVVNARDAMGDEGELFIRTQNVTEADCKKNYTGYQDFEAAEYVVIEVEDQGTGMSKEVLDKIFEPFFSTKEVGKGTGLGLSTVYGIVKQTGGYIYPESEEGDGTTFRVFLPRHIVSEQEIQEADQIAASQKEEPAKDLTGNATILLVEDEDAVRAFGSRALTARGYEVHEAASGVEALEVMEDYGDEIDLVVSDVVMPEMDGPTLLGELRKTYPDLKFIFVSGYAEEAFAKNLPEQEREKFGFLPKPFSLKQLATTVKEMLESDG